jgi:hypothetical protein
VDIVDELYERHAEASEALSDTRILLDLAEVLWVKRETMRVGDAFLVRVERVTNLPGLAMEATYRDEDQADEPSWSAIAASPDSTDRTRE